VKKIGAAVTVVVLIATLVAWACTPVLQLNIQRKQPPQNKKSCEDCHSDPHAPADRLTKSKG